MVISVFVAVLFGAFFAISSRIFRFVHSRGVARALVGILGASVLGATFFASIIAPMYLARLSALLTSKESVVLYVCLSGIVGLITIGLVARSSAGKRYAQGGIFGPR